MLEIIFEYKDLLAVVIFISQLRMKLQIELLSNLQSIHCIQFLLFNVIVIFIWLKYLYFIWKVWCCYTPLCSHKNSFFDKLTFEDVSEAHLCLDWFLFLMYEWA